MIEDQFDIGESVRMAGVKGNVEAMSLRRTVLRDDDGTLHMVPKVKSRSYRTKRATGRRYH